MGENLEQAKLLGVILGRGIPEADRQINPVLLQKWHPFVFQSPRHDFGVTECPAAAQPALAVHDAMTGQLRAFWYAVQCPAHFARTTRVAKRACNSAIGGSPSGGNPGHDLIDTIRKG